MAVADFTKAIELKPAYYAYYSRGKSLSDQGRQMRDMKKYDQSRQDYTKAIELKGDYADAYFDRASDFMIIGDNLKALADLTKVISLQPNRTEAYSQRGYIYRMKFKDADKAIADYTKVIELDPKNSSAYDNRALCFEDKKEFDKSRPDHDKANELYRIARESSCKERRAAE